MTLVATPQFGEKEVSYSAITDWIAEKLKQEFQVSLFIFDKMIVDAFVLTYFHK